MTVQYAHRRGLTRIAIAIGVCAALLGGAVVGRDTLAEETAQAHAFVADGQRALSRNERTAAVLSFERARWLAPRAQFVRSALATVGVKDVEPPLPRAFRLVTAREWAGIATVFGCASVIGMAGLVESNASSPAIVTSADAQLLVAPYANAAAETSLPAGTMVLVGSRYDAFVQVRDADGQVGWVPRASVEPIAASES